MCYEERFFLQRATTKVQKREEPKSVIDRLRPSAPVWPPCRAPPQVHLAKLVSMLSSGKRFRLHPASTSIGV